jgi:hypothetical protein
MEAADHDAVVAAVEKSKHETLVAARVFERIETHEAHALQRALALRLQHRRARRERVELFHRPVDRVEVRLEYVLEVAAVAAARQTEKPPLQRCHPAILEDQADHHEHENDRQHHDRQAQVRRDERVQIDWAILLGSGASLAGATPALETVRLHAHEVVVGPPGRGAILCRRQPPGSPSDATGGSSRIMAKRSRGAARPGQRPAKRPQRAAIPRAPAAATETIRPATSLTEADEARAAELEAQLVAEGRTATAERGGRDRARMQATAPRLRGAQTSGLLAARAAEEYGYVVRDVRRIGVVGGGLFVVMIVLFLLIEVAHVITV